MIAALLPPTGSIKGGGGMKGTVFNIMRYSVHDGPGIRTTVFLKGCPLHCKWCHNPEAISSEVELMYRKDRCLRCGDCVTACPHGAATLIDGKTAIDRELCMQCGTCVDACAADARELIGKEMSVDEVMLEIMKDVPFYDQSGGGVTFSGGEPLLQHEFLLECLKACKARRLRTALDTTGFSSPAIVERISEYTDLFLYDLKTMDDTRHKEYTGVSNALVLQNLRMLSRRGKEIIIRMPVIPGVNDQPDNIRETGAFVASLGTVREMQILPYHDAGAEKYSRLGRDNPMPVTLPASHEVMSHVAENLREYGLTINVGG